MKTSIKEISQCVRELTITIDSNTALADYKKVVNQFKNYVAIPGFRKGKAPVSIIENSFGPQIKEEFYNQKLGDYYKEAIDTEDTHPINQGEPLKFDWEKGNDLIVTFKYEIMPEIKVKKYKNLEIPFEPVKFKTEMIDATLDEYRSKMATETSIEEGEKGAIMEITVSFLDENDEVTKELKRKIEIDNNQYSKSFNTKLLGLKPEAEFKSKLFTKSQNSSDQDINDKIKDREFLIKVDSIKRKNIPELNDDFAKDLEYDSVKDLKEKVAEELKNKIKEDNKNNMKGAILSKLIEENDFELPQSIVKQVAENMAKPYAESYKMELDKMTQMYLGIAEYNLKGHYLVEEIKKIANIKLTEKEKEELIVKAAENMKMELEKYKKMHEKQIKSDDFTYAAEEEKVMDLIKESSTFVKVPKEKNQSKK
ncbi:MAG: trigger factor [Candidatus Cloacimonetes bacterium]|nr:trigger factor [Candidatus Cloacimonadota bacterium]